MQGQWEQPLNDPPWGKKKKAVPTDLAILQAESQREKQLCQTLQFTSFGFQVAAALGHRLFSKEMPCSLRLKSQEKIEIARQKDPVANKCCISELSAEIILTTYWFEKDHSRAQVSSCSKKCSRDRTPVAFQNKTVIFCFLQYLKTGAKKPADDTDT